MPFLGSAAALVFYEFVFVKSQEYLNDDESENASESGLSLGSDPVRLNNDIQKKSDVQESTHSLDD
jgi:hypothetical protein